MIQPDFTSKQQLVSIITPVYNHERFIGPCIESVLQQDYPNWEQIIIDDGSTDRTAEIICQYSDPRIHYFYQQNRGIEALAHTYNRALGLSSGEIVAILEGDDVWPSNKLSTLVPLFSNPEMVLAFGQVHDIDHLGHLAARATRIARKRMGLPRTVLFNDPVGSATAHLLSMEGQSLIAASTVVMRRTALESIGGFQYVPGICPTDVPTFVQLSQKGKFHFVTDVMGYRRRHLKSATLVFHQSMSTTPRDFMILLSQSKELPLSESERKAVRKSWRSKIYIEEFSAGRLCLLRRQWMDARLHFSRAIHISEPRFCLAAAAGWLLSWIHRDLESLFQRAGRTALRPTE
jgi:glycosyltransferase involved in cell wall biosynthesis